MTRRSETNNPAIKAGYYAGMLAFFFAVTYSVVQVLQVIGVFRFPADEILIYGSSLGIVIPFIIEMLALHYITAQEKKFWSHAALIFTVMYAVFVTANYVVQLTTVLPHKMAGTYDQVRILDQTPHSLFWDFDAMGYIFMGIAMVFAMPALAGAGPQKKVRLAFLFNGLVTPLITVVYFYPVYSSKLLFLGFPWAVTAPLAMLMLAIYFKRYTPTNAQHFRNDM